MGGLVAGTTRAPLTAIIIVFELTNDYSIILPLMITCIISTILSSKLSRESIYTLKLLLRNITIKEGTETNIMESIFVSEVSTEKFDSINIKDDFSKVVDRVLNGKASEFPVVDGKGRIKGMVSMNEIKDNVFEKDTLQDLLIAGDIARTNFETLVPDDNCQTALDKMSKYNLDGIPVVDSSTLASGITMGESDKQVRFFDGYSVAEVAAPKSFVGKSIRQLDIGAKYGVNVLSIKSKKGKRGSKIKAIPSPDSVIKTDDILVIAGETKNINLVKNLS
jgi:CIC family chloride channel protein